MRRFPSPSRLQSHIFPGSSPWWGHPGPPHCRGASSATSLSGETSRLSPQPSLLSRVAGKCPNRERPLLGSRLTPRSWLASHASQPVTRALSPLGQETHRWTGQQGASRHSASFETEMDGVPVLTGHSENSPAPAHTCRASCRAPTMRPTLLTSSQPKGAHIATLLSPMSLDMVQPFHAFKMLSTPPMVCSVQTPAGEAREAGAGPQRLLRARQLAAELCREFCKNAY